MGGLQYKSRRDMLLEYVKNVQPEFMERFVQKAPTQVCEALAFSRGLAGVRVFHYILSSGNCSARVCLSIILNFS